MFNNLMFNNKKITIVLDENNEPEFKVNKDEEYYNPIQAIENMLISLKTDKISGWP